MEAQLYIVISSVSRHGIQNKQKENTETVLCYMTYEPMTYEREERHSNSS